MDKKQLFYLVCIWLSIFSVTGYFVAKEWNDGFHLTQNLVRFFFGLSFLAMAAGSQAVVFAIVSTAFFYKKKITWQFVKNTLLTSKNRIYLLWLLVGIAGAWSIYAFTTSLNGHLDVVILMCFFAIFGMGLIAFLMVYRHYKL